MPEYGWRMLCGTVTRIESRGRLAPPGTLDTFRMQQLGTFWKRTTARFQTAPETEPSFDDQVLDIADKLVPTPIYISHRTRLILLAAIVLGVLWLFMEAPSVPRLLLIGATVALILSFPVRLLQHWMPRGLAILIVV